MVPRGLRLKPEQVYISFHIRVPFYIHHFLYRGFHHNLNLIIYSSRYLPVYIEVSSMNKSMIRRFCALCGQDWV